MLSEGQPVGEQQGPSTELPHGCRRRGPTKQHGETGVPWEGGAACPSPRGRGQSNHVSVSLSVSPGVGGPSPTAGSPGLRRPCFLPAVPVGHPGTPGVRLPGGQHRAERCLQPRVGAGDASLGHPPPGSGSKQGLSHPRARGRDPPQRGTAPRAFPTVYTNTSEEAGRSLPLPVHVTPRAARGTGRQPETGRDGRVLQARRFTFSPHIFTAHPLSIRPQVE